MLEPLRVGVVGVGHMGSYHVAAISELWKRIWRQFAT